MKRMLALAALVVFAGVNGLGMSLSGTWSTGLHLLPTPGLEGTTLELTYDLHGWAISSTSVIEVGDYVSQEFRLSGSLAFVNVEGSLFFSPTGISTVRSLSYVISDSWSGLGYDLTIQDGRAVVAPFYHSAGLSVSMDLFGLELALGVEHESHMGRARYEWAAGLVDEYLMFLDLPGYILDDDSMTLVTHPTQPPRFVFGPDWTADAEAVGLVAMAVRFEGVDDDTLEPVTHVLAGPFEVFYFNAGTGEVVLTSGADKYLWSYIVQYAAANNWMSWPISYEINPAHVRVAFLSPRMLYTLEAAADPIYAKLVLEDDCWGIGFHSALFRMTDLALCCGVTYDFELSFLKSGFEYAKFTLANLFTLMDLFVADVTIVYGVDRKELGVDWRFVGIPMDVCTTLLVEATMVPVMAIDVYGFKIRCDLADCTYAEFVSIWDLAAACQEMVQELGFLGDEFEYVKLGLCGPGCCGAEYSVDIAIYFDNGGGLFGISRFLSEFSVPFMANLSITCSLSTMAVTGDTTLGLGWVYSF